MFPCSGTALHDVRQACGGWIARQDHHDRWAFEALTRPAELAEHRDGGVIVRAPVSNW